MFCSSQLRDKKRIAKHTSTNGVCQISDVELRTNTRGTLSQICPQGQNAICGAKTNDHANVRGISTTIHASHISNLSYLIGAPSASRGSVGRVKHAGLLSEQLSE